MNFPKFWKGENSLSTMVIPHLKDADNFRCEDKVRQICRKCAEQLSAHLFRWAKQWPSRSTLKTYDKAQRRFVGLDLSLFQDYLMNHFIIKTPDGNQWLLDRSIAARIWSECVADDSPLPEASWAVEAQKRAGAA
jgi:hypothetical protein